MIASRQSRGARKKSGSALSEVKKKKGKKRSSSVVLQEVGETASACRLRRGCPRGSPTGYKRKRGKRKGSRGVSRGEKTKGGGSWLSGKRGGRFFSSRTRRVKKKRMRGSLDFLGGKETASEERWTGCLGRGKRGGERGGGVPLLPTVTKAKKKKGKGEEMRSIAGGKKKRKKTITLSERCQKQRTSAAAAYTDWKNKSTEQERRGECARRPVWRRKKKKRTEKIAQRPREKTGIGQQGGERKGERKREACTKNAENRT